MRNYDALSRGPNEKEPPEYGDVPQCRDCGGSLSVSCSCDEPEELSECDCCGERKPNVTTCFPDNMGGIETAACEDCRLGPNDL